MENSPFTQFVSTLSPNSIWVVVKVGYLFAFFIYALFAMVIVTQVVQMKKNVSLGLELFVVPAVWLHFLVAVLVFALALMLL